jgi:oxaloacetate decarboxylase beta subunit
MVWKQFFKLSNLTWQQVVMWCIGGTLIFLAIKKDMEPSLLLPWVLAPSW